MQYEFGNGKVKVSCSDESFVADHNHFLASCERLAAEEIEEQSAVLEDKQLKAWIVSELTDEEFRRAVLARVNPDVRRRISL
ncbi:MAG: hypothetical protein ACRCZF_21525 [Gemmataceae bacterium]